MINTYLYGRTKEKTLFNIDALNIAFGGVDDISGQSYTICLFFVKILLLLRNFVVQWML
jgi:hypothetical protein